MTPAIRALLLAASVLAATVVIAGTGFILGRRSAGIGNLESVQEVASSPAPAPTTWREFARTDFPRYESARVVVDGTLYILGGFWTSDIKATPRVDALDLTTGTWRRMKDMPIALTHAPAVAASGVVWLAGGFEGDHPGPATDRVWRWDPQSDNWTPGPPLPAPRGGGALVAVGEVLHYFGGFLPDRGTDSADHWRLAPGETTWTRRAPLPTPRGHLSALPIDGAIYAISGNEGHDPFANDVTVVERYDPRTDRWAALPPSPFPVSHVEGAIFEYDGRIVTVGGRALSEGRQSQKDILAFNPATGRWVHLGRMPEALLGPVAVRHGDEVIAGLGTRDIDEEGLWNRLLWASKLRDVWRTSDDLPEGLGEVAGGVIDGSLYLVGEGSDRTLRYDLAAGTWDTRSAIRPATGNHHAAEVLDGRLWLFGGMDEEAGIVQIYDPAARRWRFGPRMPFAVGSSASAAIEGRFYVAGGIDKNGTIGDAAVLDPATMTWTPIAPMPRPRNHTASGTDGRRLFVFGGRGPGSGDTNVVANGFDDVQIYDPRTNTWRVSDGSPGAPAPLPQARGGMGKAVWLDGEFWILGGETEDGPGATSERVYTRVDVYDPAANRWRTAPPLRTGRHGIFPMVYEGQIVVAGGGVTAGFSQSQVLEVLWPRR